MSKLKKCVISPSQHEIFLDTQKKEKREFDWYQFGATLTGFLDYAKHPKQRLAAKVTIIKYFTQRGGWGGGGVTVWHKYLRHRALVWVVTISGFSQFCVLFCTVEYYIQCSAVFLSNVKTPWGI